MKKKKYIENSHEAVCSECGDYCTPVCDSGDFDYEFGSIKGTHSYGETWTSDCHSADIIDSCGDEWVAELSEWDGEA